MPTLTLVPEPASPASPRIRAPRRLKTQSPDHVGIILGHQLDNVKVARRWVMQTAHTSPTRGGEIALATSELVTNALRHTRSGLPGGQVVVELCYQGRDITLRVSDDGPQEKTEPTDPSPGVSIADEDGGYGLDLVSNLASTWGWTRRGDGGVTVHAVFQSATRPRP